MKTLEADVVVVAGGGAGLAAAVTAAEGGAKVIVLEKASTLGGTSNQAEGVFAVESTLQRVKQLDFAKEDAFKVHMEFTHWRADARLVRAYHEMSASTIEWLEGLGLEFMDIGCHNPGYNYTWHLIRPEGRDAALSTQVGAGASLVKLLAERAASLGVTVLTRTPARRILKARDEVTGVAAEDDQGDEVLARARAVVVATGGFGDNPDWIKKYTGYEYGVDIFSIRIPGLVGEGIQMAWEAGAARGEMMMHLSAGGPSLRQLNPVGFSFHHPNLVVNVEGKRFIDEELLAKNLVFVGNAVSRQKDRHAFVIFDEDTKRHYEYEGLDFPGFGRPFIKASNYDAELTKALQQGFDPKFDVFVVDSLEEVAERAKIDRNEFLNTVSEYNNYCDTGRDELFFKKAKYLRPVRQPRFYVKRVVIDAFGSLGGIKTNEDMEVLDRDWNVIPGLYAAGSDANSLYGGDYAFLLPGNTFGFAINSGRLAGRSALDYLQSKSPSER